MKKTLSVLVISIFLISIIPISLAQYYDENGVEITCESHCRNLLVDCSLESFNKNSDCINKCADECKRGPSCDIIACTDVCDINQELRDNLCDSKDDECSIGCQQTRKGPPLETDQEYSAIDTTHPLIRQLQEEASRDDVTVYYGSRVGTMTREEILEHERRETEDGTTQEAGGFTSWTMDKLLDGNSWTGGILRTIGSIGEDINNQYTLDQPATQNFLREVDFFEGRNIELIEQVYEHVTSTVTTYDNPNNYATTFETMITTGTGVCRDRANLLNFALKQRGIDSQMVHSGQHTWVRVNTQIDGQQVTFDLDPTWYKEFFPVQRLGYGDVEGLRNVEYK